MDSLGSSGGSDSIYTVAVAVTVVVTVTRAVTRAAAVVNTTVNLGFIDVLIY